MTTTTTAPPKPKAQPRDSTAPSVATARPGSSDAKPAGTSGGSRPPRNKPRRWYGRKLLIVAVVLVALVIILAAVTPTTRWVAATGYLMTDQEVELRPSVEGAITRWLRPGGEVVAENEQVIQLHDAVQRAAYEQAVSELAARRAQLETLQSEHELERARLKEQIFQAQQSLALARSQLERMSAAGGFSIKEVEDAQLRVDLAQSRVHELQVPRDPVMRRQLDVLREQIDAAQKLVTLRDAELEQRKVRAPIAGTLYLNRFEPGEIVKPEHVLGQVFDRSAWVVKLKLSERDLAHVREGQPVTVSLAAYSSWRFGYVEGQVSRITPVVTPRATGDGIFYVEASTALPPELNPQPGMTATAFIHTGRTTWLMRLLGW